MKKISNHNSWYISKVIAHQLGVNASFTYSVLIEAALANKSNVIKISHREIEMATGMSRHNIDKLINEQLIEKKLQDVPATMVITINLLRIQNYFYT